MTYEQVSKRIFKKTNKEKEKILKSINKRKDKIYKEVSNSIMFSFD